MEWIWVWVFTQPLMAAAVLLAKTAMTILTRSIFAVWMVFGLPFWFILNFWTSRWWNPFDLPGNVEGLLIHIIAATLCYAIPLYLLVRLFRWVSQRKG